MRGTFTIVIQTDNAAFDDGAEYIETARILRAAADGMMERGCFPDLLMDINGNTVGEATWAPSEE